MSSRCLIGVRAVRGDEQRIVNRHDIGGKSFLWRQFDHFRPGQIVCCFQCWVMNQDIGRQFCQAAFQVQDATEWDRVDADVTLYRQEGISQRLKAGAVSALGETDQNAIGAEEELERIGGW